jgi:drug/metabolite transporter (DMT)-like permease
LTGGAVLLATSTLAGEPGAFHVRDVSSQSIAALTYLTAFGSLVAFSAYAWLMQVAPARRVAAHAYVNPLVAVALGTTLGGEPLTAGLVVAAGVIAAGVALILADRTRRNRATLARERASARGGRTRTGGSGIGRATAVRLREPARES